MKVLECSLHREMLTACIQNQHPDKSCGDFHKVVMSQLHGHCPQQCPQRGCGFNNTGIADVKTLRAVSAQACES